MPAPEIPRLTIGPSPSLSVSSSTSFTTSPPFYRPSTAAAASAYDGRIAAALDRPSPPEIAPIEALLRGALRRGETDQECAGRRATLASNMSASTANKPDQSPTASAALPGPYKRASRKGAPRRFNCDYPGCDKIYTRAEHLQRHALNRTSRGAMRDPGTVSRESRVSKLTVFCPR
jgi:hypothetical protein